jgi:hypothetical protein
MGQAITEAMRELQIEVYEGGKDAGLDLVGRSDWGEFTDVEAGSQSDPLVDSDMPDSGGVEIGMSGEMTVAVGADGQLVNQARHRNDGDAPSTHLLKIDIRPTVVFGVDRNVPVIRWVANVSVFELTTAGIVVSEGSGDVEAERALAGERPIHEYGNDPKYREALPGLLHETPRGAVRAALEKITSGGLINLPEQPDPTPVPVTTVADADDGRPGWLLPLLGLAGVAAVIILLLALMGRGNSEDESVAAPTASTDSFPTVTESVARAEPVPSVAVALPEPSIVSTTISSTTTTTTEPPEIDLTIFDILDFRCIVRATGEPADGCLQALDITRSGVGPSLFSVGLTDGTEFSPDVVGTLSMFLTEGPGNDVLVE